MKSKKKTFLLGTTLMLALGLPSCKGSDPTPTYKEYQVTLDSKTLNINQTKARDDTDFEAKISVKEELTPKEKYILPKSISVAIQDTELKAEDFTWNADDGSLKIVKTHIKGEVKIKAEAEYVRSKYTAECICTQTTGGLDIDNKEATEGLIFTTNIHLAGEYTVDKWSVPANKDSVLVQVDGKSTTDFTYKPNEEGSAAEFSLDSSLVTGKIVITANAEERKGPEPEPTKWYAVTHKTNYGFSFSGTLLTPEKQDYKSTYTPISGYVLPETISVKVSGVELDPTQYSWAEVPDTNKRLLQIPGASVVGQIEIFVDVEEDPNPVFSADMLVLKETQYATWEIVGISNRQVSFIEVPNEINGKRITHIAKGAFLGCANVERITLPFVGSSFNPDGLEPGSAYATGEYNLGWIFGDDLGAIEGCDKVTQTSYKYNGYEYISSSHSFNIPKKLKKVEIRNNLTYLGESSYVVPAGAFSHCTNLTDINIENGCVDSISYSAFEYCTSLKDFIIPRTVTLIEDFAFFNCPSLGMISIPDTVSYCGYGLFYQYFSSEDKEKNARMYASVLIMVERTKGQTESWDSGWFETSTYARMHSVVYDSNNKVKDIGKYKIAILNENNEATILKYTSKSEKEDATVNIPEKLTDTDPTTGKTTDYKLIGIGCSAFANDMYIRKIYVPKTIKEIGASAFSCMGRAGAGLEEVYFPEGADELVLGDSVCYNCPALKGFYISNTYLTEIGPSAFEDCIALEGIALPDTVTAIGDYAFANCSALRSVSNFENCKKLETLGKYIFYYCGKLQNIIIPTELKNIPDGFLCGCRSYETIATSLYDDKTKEYLFTGLRSIGAFAFSYTGLTKVNLSSAENLTDIKEYAFDSCDLLVSFIFPDASSTYGGELIKLYSNVFFGCTNLGTNIRFYLPLNITFDTVQGASGREYYVDPFTTWTTTQYIYLNGNLAGISAWFYDKDQGIEYAQCENGLTKFPMSGEATLGTWTIQRRESSTGVYEYSGYNHIDGETVYSTCGHAIILFEGE